MKFTGLKLFLYPSLSCAFGKEANTAAAARQNVEEISWRKLQNLLLYVCMCVYLCGMKDGLGRLHSPCPDSNPLPETRDFKFTFRFTVIVDEILLRVPVVLLAEYSRLTRRSNFHYQFP